jgi:type I restriction enzyme, S subunit
MTFRQAQYPAEWNIKTIGTASEVVNGGTPKTGVSEYWNGKHLWITPAEMGKRQSPYVENTKRKLSDVGLNNSSAQLLPPNSVILSSRAPIGHLVINTKPMATNQGCKGLIPSSILYYKFLYYYLYHNVDLLNLLGTGATFKELSGGKLKEIPIPLPPLPEQKRIVGILDEAFAAIATAKANAEKNLANARELFQSYLQGVFANPGDGWEEKKLGEVCAITSTLVDPREDEFLDLTHVGAGNIDSQTSVFVKLKTAQEEGLISGKFLFDKSMVLYSKIRPYLMKVARPDFNGLCSADMYPLTPLPNEITRDYLFHLLLSKRFTDYAIQGSARAGMPKVNRKHLFEFKVWLPAVKKQKEIAIKIDALSAETKKLEAIYRQKLADLEELKKSVLQKAFNGELTANAKDAGCTLLEAGL